MQASLVSAVWEGDAQTVRQLLLKGAHPDAADTTGRIPLYVAAAKGHSEVVQLLLDAGAALEPEDDHSSRPLTAAAMAGHADVVQLLLAAGAAVNVGDVHNWTPLHQAATDGRQEVVQLLLHKGADPRLKDDSYGNALHAAACFDSTTGVIQLLLEEWGQPQVTFDVLMAAAQKATLKRNVSTYARLANELRRLYPAQLHQLFERHPPLPAAQALAAMLDEQKSDVSSLDEQRAALCKREEAVAKERYAVQQLIVGVAGIAKHAQKPLERQDA